MVVYVCNRKPPHFLLKLTTIFSHTYTEVRLQLYVESLIKSFPTFQITTFVIAIKNNKHTFTSKKNIRMYADFHVWIIITDLYVSSNIQQTQDIRRLKTTIIMSNTLFYLKVGNVMTKCCLFAFLCSLFHLF